APVAVGVTEVGLNDALAPDGSPVAESLAAEPDPVSVTVTFVDFPGRTDTVPELADTVNVEVAAFAIAGDRTTSAAIAVHTARRGRGRARSNFMVCLSVGLLSDLGS